MFFDLVLVKARLLLSALVFVLDVQRVSGFSKIIKSSSELDEHFGASAGIFYSSDRFVWG